jgi:two-component system repressor protein LuxO
MVMTMTKDKNALILIVEDDENLANAFAYILDEFDVKVCYDGSEAMTWLETETNIPKVVLLDLNLPGVPGSEILDYIRSQERMAKTRVFLASADHLLSGVLREKADLVLQKPVGASQLKQLVEKFA